jgi:hypothetical protein
MTTRNIQLDKCCDAMRHALDEGYLYQPLYIARNKTITRGKPALYGPKISRRESKPTFFLNLCPWCGHDYGESVS